MGSGGRYFSHFLNMKKYMILSLCLLGWIPFLTDAVAEESASPFPASSQQGEQKFKGFNLQGYNESGTKTWDVTGKTADIIGSIVKLTDVVANVYGQEKMNVTAKLGTVDQQSGDRQIVLVSNSDHPPFVQGGKCSRRPGYYLQCMYYTKFSSAWRCETAQGEACPWMF